MTLFTGQITMIEGYLYKASAYGTLEWMPPVIGTLEFSQ